MTAPFAPRFLVRMTWEEVRDLPPSRAVALLPVGAIEAHGPHLPLGTDGIIAGGMAREGARRLEEADHPTVLLPELPYTAAPFAAAFPGTLSLEAGAVTRIVVETGRALGAQGFAAFAIVNAHLDPTHLESLRKATAILREEGVRVAFPDLTRRALALRLTEEFRSGACHAGQFEGSVVLAQRPEWVREEVMRSLPSHPVSLSDAIREGRTSFHEAGGDRAYFGHPARATAAEGRATLEVLGEILAEAVLEVLEPPRAGPHRAEPHRGGPAPSPTSRGTDA
jgi:creatinine amidohydrolase